MAGAGKDLKLPITAHFNVYVSVCFYFSSIQVLFNTIRSHCCECQRSNVVMNIFDDVIRLAILYVCTLHVTSDVSLVRHCELLSINVKTL